MGVVSELIICLLCHAGAAPLFAPQESPKRRRNMEEKVKSGGGQSNRHRCAVAARTEKERGKEWSYATAPKMCRRIMNIVKGSSVYA